MGGTLTTLGNRRGTVDGLLIDRTSHDNGQRFEWGAAPMKFVIGFFWVASAVLLGTEACRLAVGPVLADTGSSGPVHAIAMHGTPKYKSGFPHLDYVDPDAPKGGVLRLAAQGMFDNINPFIVKGTTPPGQHYVFESLLKRSHDEPFTLYASIAESVEMAADRSWVRFNLRPEARFHDGTPITADDVIFSWKILREKGRPHHRLYYSEVLEARREGLRTVHFSFGAGDNREMPMIMGLMPIVSKAYFAKEVFDRTTLKAPLGSGPYHVADVDPGRRIVYRRVKDYWGAKLPINRGLYNFDEIRFDYYRDSNVSFEAFKAGDYDFHLETSPSRWAVGYDFPAAREGRVKKLSPAHGRPVGMRAFVFNTRNTIFKDRLVRQALAYAFDFEWMNRILFHGAYKRTRSYFANSDLASTSSLGARELALLEPFRDKLPKEVFTSKYRPPISDGSGFLRANLKRAAALLKEAGWVIEEGSLIHRDTGRTMDFEILLLRPSNERIALAFARNLKRIGIRARVRTVDSSQYQFRVENFDFDVTIKWWYQSLSPGNEQRYYWGSKAAHLTGSANLIGIEDDVVDSLLDTLTGSRTRAELIAAARALDRVLLWGHYVVPLYHEARDRLAYWDKFVQPELTPTGGFMLEAWWSNKDKSR